MSNKGIGHRIKYIMKQTINSSTPKKNNRKTDFYHFVNDLFNCEQCNKL